MKIEKLLEAFDFEATSELYNGLFDLEVPIEKLKEIVEMLWEEGLEIYSNEKQAGTISLTADDCMFLHMTFDDDGQLEKVELFIKLLGTEMTPDGIVKFGDDSEIPNQTN